MRESDIKNKWSFLLKDMNFDNKYHDDIEYYLEYHYGEIINAKILSFDAIQVPYDILEIRKQKIKKIKKLIDEKRFN